MRLQPVVLVHAPAGAAQAERVFGHVLGAALYDAAGADHPPGDFLQLIGAAAHHDHFQTMLVVQMNVHRNARLRPDHVAGR